MFKLTNNQYTDLAIEAHETARATYAKEIEKGVKLDRREIEGGSVVRVEILSQEAAEKMGKEKGIYITIESDSLCNHDRKQQEKISQSIAKEIGSLVNLPQDSLVLVVGLGNWNATPDALGPRVVENVLVTRHLHEFAPDLKGGTRPVAAIAPGVLGITGMETGEIIRGIVEKIKPDLLIVIDALAARSLERINRTIQISNTGIQPGSGVGNKRMAITEKVLGIPVIAIGVPTIVHSGTIAYTTLKILVDYFEEKKLSAIIKEIEKHGEELFNDVVPKFVGDLMVTPKDIDVIIDDLSRVVAGGINVALHPHVDMNEAMLYLK